MLLNNIKKYVDNSADVNSFIQEIDIGKNQNNESIIEIKYLLSKGEYLLFIGTDNIILKYGQHKEIPLKYTVDVPPASEKIILKQLVQYLMNISKVSNNIKFKKIPTEEETRFKIMMIDKDRENISFYDSCGYEIMITESHITIGKYDIISNGTLADGSPDTNLAYIKKKNIDI